MTAPPWLTSMLGWKEAAGKSRSKVQGIFGQPFAPNLSDVGGPSSMRIAAHCYDALGIGCDRRAAGLESDLDVGDGEVRKTSDGIALERAIEKDIRSALECSPDRAWQITHAGSVSDYEQFQHLAALQAVVDGDTSGLLRGTLPADYQVKSDIYVGVQWPGGGRPLLHAAIASKWTIRSDRVQNVRQEFHTLVRNRKGRLPHLVLVTAEPLPSRILSIARGTGELDAVYHLLFDEIGAAVAELRDTDRYLAKQARDWDEMTQQLRVLPYSDLAARIYLS